MSRKQRFVQLVQAEKFRLFFCAHYTKMVNIFCTTRLSKKVAFSAPEYGVWRKGRSQKEHAPYIRRTRWKHLKNTKNKGKNAAFDAFCKRRRESFISAFRGREKRDYSLISDREPRMTAARAVNNSSYFILLSVTAAVSGVLTTPSFL